ncbi:hypothetical protein LOTGIDRAFT_231111 [Lottia gigantea]|uniref:Uncharacterized protein n=1 Tax=Lottia gigantea TaxID=225164 RepID=V4CC99_LOTGI|nr:hypothetical protein LOTGIDRAFT_231111 [Lottia gigantea]ESO99514.1 hypothetical protein LOTGIDRAFT_231111 [Lottia gigantea]
MSAPMNEKQIAEEIKKIRKKLKQIANLERKEHSLTHKEKNKINKKTALRKELFSLLLVSEKELAGIPVKATTKVKTENRKTKPKQNVREKKSKEIKESEPKLSVKTNVVDRPDIEADETDENSDNELQRSEEEESESESSDYLPQTCQSAQLTDNTYTQLEQDAQKNKNTNSKVNTQPTTVSAQPRPVPIRNPLKEKWQKVECIVEELNGHNDIVTSLDISDDYLVTASRDTTVKVWNIETGMFIRSLGGHTETITTVIIVQDNSLIEGLEVDADDKIIISGSTDCSFKLWSLHTGQLITSVYTYNPITSLVYSTNLLVTASGGGKIELWDLNTSENINSIRNDEDAITCITAEKNLVYSSSEDGIIKVYEIRERKLCCLFESDNLDLINRYIRCIISCNNILYYGDDGINIKAVNWKKGSVVKYPNHTEEFASTDASTITDNLLLTSSYNLDHGYGYINVRELPSCEYQFSLIDKDTERIVCLKSTKLKNGEMIIVTGGSELQIWRIGPKSRFLNDHRTKCKLRFIEKLTRKGHDSDNEESDDDDNDDDDFNVEVNDNDYDDDNDLTANPDEVDKSWSWCEIL